MWIVRLALQRRTRLSVMALVIILLTPIVLLRTPTDIFLRSIFPSISLVWTYNGLQPQEMELRITGNVGAASPAGQRRRAHGITITSRHCRYQGVFPAERKYSDGPRADRRYRANVFAFLAAGNNAAAVIIYSASTVPSFRLASRAILSANSSSLIRQQLHPYAARHHSGRATPFPYGGKQRSSRWIRIPPRFKSHGLSAVDIVNAVAAQNLILPAGTAKMGSLEIHRRNERQSAKRERTERFAGKKNRKRRHNLHARSGSRPRRFFAANQRRSRKRPARRAHEHLQDRQRFHARHRGSR